MGGAGLVSIAMAPAPRPVAGRDVPAHAQPTYVCPMCAEVRQIGPGPRPKCGMALEPDSPVLPTTKAEYTCPMHPEIVRSEHGSGPITGMAPSLGL